MQPLLFHVNPFLYNLKIEKGNVPSPFGSTGWFSCTHTVMNTFRICFRWLEILICRGNKASF